MAMPMLPFQLPTSERQMVRPVENSLEPSSTNRMNAGIARSAPSLNSKKQTIKAVTIVRIPPAMYQAPIGISKLDFLSTVTPFRETPRH